MANINGIVNEALTNQHQLRVNYCFFRTDTTDY